MPPLVLTDAFAYVAGHDFTGDSNSIMLPMAAEDLDATTFRSGGWRERAGGLKSHELSLSGFWQAGAGEMDPDAFNDLGVAARAHTIGPDETEGSVAYLFRAGKFSYQLLGEVGQLAPFELKSQGTNGEGVIRGQLAKAMGDVSATGQLGSVLNLGAPAAGQSVYCAVHVFAAGTTITLKLQSDTASGFPSATDRATIGPITAAGGTWMTPLPGAIAGETHWRLNVTAITGTFTIAAAIGVQ